MLSKCQWLLNRSECWLHINLVELMQSTQACTVQNKTKIKDTKIIKRVNLVNNVQNAAGLKICTGRNTHIKERLVSRQQRKRDIHKNKIMFQRN